jgi:hypothetical protein
MEQAGGEGREEELAPAHEGTREGIETCGVHGQVQDQMGWTDVVAAPV